MAVDPKATVARFARLKSEAGNHFNLCDKMAPYVAPSRTNILRVLSPGEKQTRELYDSTALQAAEMLAHFVASYSMNPSQVWGGMTPRLGEASDTLQEWFEECRDILLKDFASSMFYAEMPESLIDWCGFGTGCLITDEAPSPINRTVSGWRGSYYEAMRTGKFVIADGADGLVDTVMYEKPMSANAIKARFGNNLPEEVKKALEKGEGDKAFMVVRGIYPRPESERRYAAGAKGMPYVSCWIEQDSKFLLEESGYQEFPGAIPRYTRTPGEVFGRGRGHLAFPDAWTLNRSKHYGLEDLALKQRPPMLYAHDSVMGTLKLTPGGPTPIHTRGRSIRDVIMPYDTGSRPEVANLSQEDLRKSIRQIFFVDQILMLMEVNKSEMTAFEFAKKMELLFRTLGPVYGRLRKEFMERIWHVKFVQLWHAKALPQPPQEFYDADGGYDIVFENPLERAQRVGDVEATTMAIQDLIPLAQVKPSVWDWIDTDEETQHILKTRGVRAKSIRSPQEVKAYREAQAQQEQQDLQLAQAGQIAEAAGKAAPMLTALQGGSSK